MAFIKYGVGDNKRAELASPIDTTTTSITVKTGQGAQFGTDYPYILTIEQIDGDELVVKMEKVKFTGRSGDVLTVERGFDGTTPLSFDADDFISLYVGAPIVKDIQDEVTRLETDKLDIDTYIGGGEIYGASSAGTDAYVIALNNTPASLTEGLGVRVKADVANTGAATLNIGVGGAKTIKKPGGSDLADGDIPAGGIIDVIYDGTNWQMQTPVANAPSADINGLDAIDAIHVDDELMIYDDSVAGNKKVKMDDVYSSYRVTAGEALTAGNAVRLGIDAAGGNVSQTSNNDNTIFGYDTTSAYVGQSFTTTNAGVLTNIQLRFYKFGTPSNTLTCRLYSDTSGTLVATSTNTINGGDVTTSAANYDFTFDDVDLDASTQYFRRLQTSSFSTSHYYRIRYQNTNVYGGGIFYTINSSNARTGDSGKDQYFVATIGAGSEVNTKVYKADATSAGKANIIGFANKTVALDAELGIDAVVTRKQSGLTPGSTYYLSDTPGAISTTAGTVSKEVGKAVSATILAVNLFA